MMKRLTEILSPTDKTKKTFPQETKDSKHSPVYRKRGAEGFSPLFSFLFVYLNKMGGKMKTSIKYCCLISVLLFMQISGQAQVKGIISYANMDPDNAVLGDTTTITIVAKFISSITNTDTLIFGNVFFRYQTNWMWDYNHDYTETMDDNPGAQTVNPGNQIYTCPIYVNPNPNYFRTGPVNVIIIWPAFYNPAIPLVDSAFYPLYNQDVSLPAGFEEQGSSKFGSTVFPNPAQSMQLVFINSKYSQQIEKISIINTMGQTISSKEFFNGEDSKGYVLPTEELRPGLYHIQLFYQDKKVEVVKFIKN